MTINLPYNQFDSFMSLAESEDLVCFSPVRWKALAVHQREVINELAAHWRVFFIEEPAQQPVSILTQTYDRGCLYISAREAGVWSVVPYLPDYGDEEKLNAAKQRLLGQLFDEAGIHEPIMWYLTPDAIAFTRNLCSWVTIYDCTERYHPQSSVKSAQYQSELIQRTDLMLESALMPSSTEATCSFMKRSIMQAAHSRQYRKVLSAYPQAA